MNTVLMRTILLLAALVLCLTPAVQAYGNMESGFGLGICHGELLHQYSHETCTREAMQQCEYACMMPGGILDLNCYEDCIYSIC